MGACPKEQFVRTQYDKNAAADYLSRRLGRIFSGEAVRQLHIRKTCRAVGKFQDGRLLWDRESLDNYVERVRPDRNRHL